MTGKSNCKLYCLFGTSIFLIIFSVALIISWPYLFHFVVKKMLTLKESSLIYEYWAEPPVSINFELHIFNWTNALDFESNKSLKPTFEDLGPYVFSEKHVRTNVTWNDNGTVTFQQKRIWYFEPELSNGTLNDEIVNINLITASAGYLLRSRIRLIKAALDFVLKDLNEKLTIKKKLRELLFEGYEDKFLTMVHDLKVVGFENIPFYKVGIFYSRNDSSGFDGIFNMYTGQNNIEDMGILNSWNYMKKTNFYQSDCGAVNGTTGELWPPFENTDNLTIFVPDICRSITLDYQNDLKYGGVNGKKYIGTDRIFDNGTKYSDASCFSQGNILPSGVLNTSLCVFGAPLFISFPHFHLADSTYRTNIDIKPKQMENNEFYIVMEPNFGIPLTAQGQFQMNILIDDHKHLPQFESVKRTLIPFAWFQEKANLPDDLTKKAKWGLIISKNARFVFIAFGGIGILILCITIYLSIKK